MKEKDANKRQRERNPKWTHKPIDARRRYTRARRDFKDRKKEKNAPVAKHTAKRTRNMYPPVYASVVETMLRDIFCFF